jgi:hypothetical protein
MTHPLGRTLVAAASLGLLVGCITETVRPARGVPLRPADTRRPAAPMTTSPAQPVPLPTEPIATPATASQVVASRVQVEVVPLGTVIYDGANLPLASPDGRFIVVQDGEAPQWEAVLAEPGAQAAVMTSLGVYEVGDKTLTRIPAAQALPSGVLLGRASDDAGFLVEYPRPDGSRWIGRVSWVGGALKWLVQSSAVNAHAVLTSRGELVYTRRAVESDRAELVAMGPGQGESVRAPQEGTYAFPMCTDDPDVVYVLQASANGVELQAIRLERADVAGPPKLGATIARRGIMPAADALAAFQIACTAQPALPLREGKASRNDLTIFNPRVGRMTEFSLQTSSFGPLAPKSIAAAVARGADRPGYYCTTPEGFVFYPSPRGGEAPSLDISGVRVLGSPYVPRRIQAAHETMLLFGPVKGRPDQLEVVRMLVAPSAPIKDNT